MNIGEEIYPTRLMNTKLGYIYLDEILIFVFLLIIMKNHRYTMLLTAVVAALSLSAACSKPDRSEEATQLKNELQEIIFSNPEKVLERVDSAERTGVFTETTANLIRSNVYGHMGKTRLAVFYGEQIKHSPELRSEGVNYYSALLQLTSLLNKNGDWGKAIHLADEIIADADQGGLDEQMALRIKSRALTNKASCEQNMGHLEEAERYIMKSGGYGEYDWRNWGYITTDAVDAIMADIYLWRASYTNSQQDYLNAIAMYHDFFTFPREEVNTGNYDVAWMDRDFHGMSDSYINYFIGASELCAGVLPMDTTTYYGNVADLAAVFNSKYSNKYYPAAIPSQRMKDISKSQDYCYYTTDGKISEIIMGSHNPNDYENKLYEGDLRLSSIYYTMSNFRESQYNSDVNPMMMVNNKYYTSTSSDRRIQYIPLFRYTTLYLHMAEALNRAGFPETAFAILAHGLSYYTMNDRSIISQDEFDRLCNIKSRGFTISEANYTGDLRAKTTGSFVIWSSDVFGTLDKNSGAATTRVQGGPKVQIGIHSLGCGDTEYNVMYNLDDSATIAGLTPYRELRPMEDLPVLTRKSTHEDSLEYQRIYDANVLADSLNKVDIAEVDAINVAYLASPAVRATRQAHVSKLILEEEAIEGMFEGLRFYDIMRYQMQEKQGAGIGKTIAMPAFITEKYGATPSMEGKPWYLPMPTR